jgi:multicomponent Na+:H+ antiporter subunit A
MALWFVVFAPALAATFLLIAPRAGLARLFMLIPAVSFLYLLSLIPHSEAIQVTLPWVPSLGVSLSLVVSGLGLLFALLISGIGTLVLLYAFAYFDKPADYVRFSGYTLLFMTAMLGIVLSDNLLLIFVFWELTSISSYLLIGFKHEKLEAREGARRALLVTGVGGLAMMAGFLLVGITAGTFELTAILQSGETLRDSPLYSAMLLLILAGAFTKSAQYPFHFWLPGAMEAPTPASTYLHSATMVKAGVFLLARLSPVLNNTDLWFWTITGFGLVTFLYGAVFALRQTDLKAILAYSTVSWLGILVALQGSGSEYAAIALSLGVLGHALYKGALFLVTGSVDHATGTRDINQIGGLARKMPLTFAAALIAVLNMAGIPPFLGFLAKETLKAASLYEGLPAAAQVLFPAAAVVGSALTVMVALRILWDVFIGQTENSTAQHAHEVHAAMWLAPLILGIVSLLLPFLIPQVLEPLVSQAVSSVRGQESEIHLHLFEGINMPLIMSVIAIVSGWLLFMVRRPIISLLRAGSDLNPVGIYQWLFFTALPGGAEWLTRRLQNGRLRNYMMMVIGAFIILTFTLVLVGKLNLLTDDVLAGFDWKVVAVCLLLMLGAIASIFAPTRLSVIVVLGIEGALLSLLFALFGAPDLAFTQLMIEVITLVLFVLAFHFLPEALTTRSGRWSRLLDAGLAVGAGFAVTVLILAARANNLSEPIGPWFIENSVPVGQGHNVVNVILVDFRGMDTQGEITVLVIAAMGVTALLRLRPSGQPRGKRVTQEIKMVEPISPPNAHDQDAALEVDTP